jgi:hypothetical protein
MAVDWDTRIFLGNGRAELFYLGGALVAIDKEGATGTTYTWQGQTAPLARAEELLGDGKLRKRDGALLFPGAVAGRAFASNDPINTPLLPTLVEQDTTSLHFNNADGSGGPRQIWIEGQGGNSAHVWTGLASDPTWNIAVPPHNGRPSGTLTLKAPANMAQPGGADRSLTLINGNVAYDFWLANLNTTAHTATCSAWGCAYIDGTAGGIGPGGFWIAGKSTGDGPIGGQDWYSGKNGGVRASNINWLAGSITAADVAAAKAGGDIQHALVVAVQSNLRFAASVAPFTAYETSGPPSGPSFTANGARIYLLSSYTIPAGATLLTKAIMRAMKTYGAYIVDGTGGLQIFFYGECGQNPALDADLNPSYQSWNFSNTLNDMVTNLRLTTSY